MWLGSNPGHVLMSFVVCELFRPAYRREAALEAYKSGLFPCNRHIFHDHEFACRQMANFKINVLMELAMKFQDWEH